MLDLAIIGGGPAALSAAIYAARGGLGVKVFEKADFGGTLPWISQIENYPGYLGGTGVGLAKNMREQAERAGAELAFGECTDLEKADSGFILTIDEEKVAAKAVLVATGSKPRKLSFTPAVPTSYCALCDGPLVKGKHVAVIGGANSAVQEAFFLANVAKDVTIITHSQLKADQELLDRLPNYKNIHIVENVEPNAENLAEFDHIFVYIGKLPATDFLQKLAKKYPILSSDGYVVTDSNYETAVKGLYAAGDVRDQSIKQIVVAAAEGAVVANNLF